LPFEAFVSSTDVWPGFIMSVLNCKTGTR
jgi:hypothetical protein